MQTLESLGILSNGVRRVSRIQQLYKPQVCQVPGQPRPVCQLLIQQLIGIAGRKIGLRGINLLYRQTGLIEQGKADGIATSALTHDVQATIDNVKGIFFVKVLEVDRKLGVYDVDAASGARPVQNALQTGQG